MDVCSRQGRGNQLSASAKWGKDGGVPGQDGRVSLSQRRSPLLC